MDDLSGTHTPAPTEKEEESVSPSPRPPVSPSSLEWRQTESEYVADCRIFRVRRDISALRTAPSRDVFLIKVAYWLPM